MTRKNIRKCLDYLPFLVLCIQAINAFYTFFQFDMEPHWNHYAGVIALVITGYFFYRKHALGVVATGITLLAGLIGLVSYTFTVYTAWFSVSFGAIDNATVKTPIFNPIFLVFLLVHFLLSARYYFGILSKDYWKKIMENN